MDWVLLEGGEGRGEEGRAGEGRAGEGRAGEGCWLLPLCGHRTAAGAALMLRLLPCSLLQQLGPFLSCNHRWNMWWGHCSLLRCAVFEVEPQGPAAFAAALSITHCPAQGTAGADFLARTRPLAASAAHQPTAPNTALCRLHLRDTVRSCRSWSKSLPLLLGSSMTSRTKSIRSVQAPIVAVGTRVRMPAWPVGVRRRVGTAYTSRP